MDLDRYVRELREQLTAAAAAGGAEAQHLAERLVPALESGVRLALLDALSAAAADITADLAPISVEVRLRGREPEFVVTTPPPPPDEAAAPDPEAGDLPLASATDDAATARINLRLPQDLKDRVEDAARTAGLSVNSWLVRAAAAGLGRRSPASAGSPPRVGDRYRGWVR